MWWSEEGEPGAGVEGWGLEKGKEAGAGVKGRGLERGKGVEPG